MRSELDGIATTIGIVGIVVVVAAGLTLLSLKYPVTTAAIFCTVVIICIIYTIGKIIKGLLEDL